jgi:hypothetical protein
MIYPIWLLILEVEVIHYSNLEFSLFFFFFDGLIRFLILILSWKLYFVWIVMNYLSFIHCELSFCLALWENGDEIKVWILACSMYLLACFFLFFLPILFKTMFSQTLPFIHFINCTEEGFASTPTFWWFACWN